MFDIAWTEILIIAIVAILVVGPRELPAMLRTIGKFMGQMRRMAGDFQKQFNDAIRETELDDVKRGIEGVRSANPLNKIKDDLNPLKKAGDDLRRSIESPGGAKPQSGSAAAAASAQDRPSVSSKPKPAAASAKTAGTGTTAASKPTNSKPAAPKTAKPAASKPAASKPAASKPAPAAAKAKPAAAKPAAKAKRTPKAKPAPADGGSGR